MEKLRETNRGNITYIHIRPKSASVIYFLITNEEAKSLVKEIVVEEEYSRIICE